MRILTFAKRCSKEILRDPLNLIFGLGFPLVLLFLLSAIQKNVPVSMFEIDTRHYCIWLVVYDTVFSNLGCQGSRKRAFAKIIYNATHGFGFYYRIYASASTNCARANGDMLSRRYSLGTYCKREYHLCRCRNDPNGDL